MIYCVHHKLCLWRKIWIGEVTSFIVNNTEILLQESHRGVWIWTSTIFLESKFKLHFREPHVLARMRFPSFLKSLFSGRSRPSDKGEGGGGRSSRPWDKGGGVSKKLGKKFWSKNKVGGGPPLDPPLLFQSESRPCETIAMKMIISILVQIKWNSFSLERFCTKPCFESDFLDFVNGLLSTCYMTAHADTKVFIYFISKGN